MVEDLAFHGVRNAAEAATCPAGYDRTSFPRGNDWGFTRFYMPQAVAGGYALADDATVLWEAFDRLHHKRGLPDPRVTAQTVRAACQRSRSPVLQFCGHCMWRGYHGVVHQFGPEARCPVHDNP